MFYIISSNVNEVIRAVLKSLFIFFFFAKRFRSHKKHKKHKNANKRLSDFFPLHIFYAHKTLPFLFLFAYVRFVLFVRVKKRKKKKEKSPHNVDVLNIDVPTTRLMY